MILIQYYQRYLIEDEINIDELVYNHNEVVSINWYTKQEILNKIKDGKVNKGYAYILEKYLNQMILYMKETH